MRAVAFDATKGLRRAPLDHQMPASRTWGGLANAKSSADRAEILQNVCHWLSQESSSSWRRNISSGKKTAFLLSHDSRVFFVDCPGGVHYAFTRRSRAKRRPSALVIAAGANRRIWVAGTVRLSELVCRGEACGLEACEGGLMRKIRVLMVVTAVALVATLGALFAQRSTTRNTALITGQDYYEIMQMYTLFNWGWDYRDIDMFVSAYAEDGRSTNRKMNWNIKGHEEIREWRRKGWAGETGDSKSRHVMPLPGSWQILGKARDGGIRVRYWWAMLNTEHPPRFDSTGWAEDILVKTGNGWKIKLHDVHIDSERDQPPAPDPGSVP
jgi:hypothetical protein